MTKRLLQLQNDFIVTSIKQCAEALLIMIDWESPKVSVVSWSVNNLLIYLYVFKTCFIHSNKFSKNLIYLKPIKIPSVTISWVVALYPFLSIPCINSWKYFFCYSISQIVKLSFTWNKIISPPWYRSWKTKACFTPKFTWFQIWVSYTLYYKTIQVRFTGPGNIKMTWKEIR